MLPPWACRESTKASTKGDHTGASVRHRGSRVQGLTPACPPSPRVRPTIPRATRARAPLQTRTCWRMSSRRGQAAVGPRRPRRHKCVWSIRLGLGDTLRRRGSDAARMPPRRSSSFAGSNAFAPRATRRATRVRTRGSPESSSCRPCVTSWGAPGRRARLPTSARPRPTPWAVSPTRSSAIVRENTRNTSAPPRPAPTPARSPTSSSRSGASTDNLLGADDPASPPSRAARRPPGRAPGDADVAEFLRFRDGIMRARARPRASSPARSSPEHRPCFRARVATRRPDHPALSAAASAVASVNQPAAHVPRPISPSAPRRRR